MVLTVCQLGGPGFDSSHGWPPVGMVRRVPLTPPFCAEWRGSAAQSIDCVQVELLEEPAAVVSAN